VVSASWGRSAVRYLQQQYAVSERNGMFRAGYLRMRYGYRRIQVLLRREGIRVNRMCSRENVWRSS